MATKKEREEKKKLEERLKDLEAALAAEIASQPEGAALDLDRPVNDAEQKFLDAFAAAARQEGDATRPVETAMADFVASVDKLKQQWFWKGD